MGHIHGFDVNSPSLGLNPALLLTMTTCDSMNRWMKFGANSEKLVFGTA